MIAKTDIIMSWMTTVFTVTRSPLPLLPLNRFRNPRVEAREP